MRKTMIEEMNGLYVVSCFENGVYVFEEEFDSPKKAMIYAELYVASNWRLSNAPSSLAINQCPLQIPLFFKGIFLCVISGLARIVSSTKSETPRVYRYHPLLVDVTV